MDSCAALSKKICEKSEKCDEATKWLDDRLKEGPDGMEVAAAAKDLGCDMVLKDERALNSYKRAFHRHLKKADKKK